MYACYELQLCNIPYLVARLFQPGIVGLVCKTTGRGMLGAVADNMFHSDKPFEKILCAGYHTRGCDVGYQRPDSDRLTPKLFSSKACMT